MHIVDTRSIKKDSYLPRDKRNSKVTINGKVLFFQFELNVKDTCGSTKSTNTILAGGQTGDDKKEKDHEESDCSTEATFFLSQPDSISGVSKGPCLPLLYFVFLYFLCYL